MHRDVVVLVAEDDPGHAMLMERNLRCAGFVNEIRQFPDGEQLLEFLFDDKSPVAHDPRALYLLLLDIRMPRVDGTEVLRRIKTDQRLREMPCVMLSSTDDPREVAKCEQLGVSSYIVKPLVADRFLETLRRLGLSLSIVGTTPAWE